MRQNAATAIESCVICGGHPLAPLIAIGSWSVQECRQCGHGVVSPFPDEEKLSELYNSTYFRERYHEPLRRDSPAFARRIRQEAHRIRFVKRFCRGGRLLDVGCGCGYFLLAAREAGLDPVGTDLTAANRCYIESELGEKLLVGELTGLPLEAETFDVITLWHTLEHHPDPASSVQQCLRWLKRDGVLIVEVPNHDTIDARKYGPKWPNWDLPFHLHHFTERSLKRLLQTAGAHVLTVKTYHSEYIRQQVARTGILKPLARLIAAQYKGGGVLMACRKR
ncbi:MAG: class I SAM-dependent methyltransferase [Thermodesulfobacteriota bacterium]|jgi:SAM-dependent methyltransferase